MLLPAQRQALIEKIRALPSQLEALVSNLTAEELITPFLADEWTVAQNVHHLADSHMNSYIRLKLILTEAQPTLKPYDQNLWAELADADQADLSMSLLLLKGLHHRWVMVFESLNEAAWQRCGLHPEIGEISVEDILRIYADHGEGHLDQITRTLAAR